MLLKSKLMLALFALAVLVTKPTFAADETNETLMPKGMWKDPATGLVWMRCSVGQTWSGTNCDGQPTQYNWEQALTTVDNLQFEGHDDWRVPTIEDLSSIRDCSTGFSRGEQTIPANQGGTKAVPIYCKDGANRPTININKFPRTKDFMYWSSSPNTYISSNAWLVLFDNGYSANDNKKNLAYVRAVRSSQSLGQEALGTAFSTQLTQTATNTNIVPKNESCINSKPPFTLKPNETTKFYGDCNANLEIVTGVLVHTNTKANSSDLICYVSGAYTPWYNGGECRKKLSTLPNYCEYDNYKGQCVNGRANGVGEKFSNTSSDIGFGMMDNESLAGQFTNGNANGFIRKETIGRCGMAGCAVRGRTEYHIYRNGEDIAECAEDSRRIGLCEASYKAQTEASNRREAEENRRIAEFRKSVQEGDDTSQGIVVQIKGNLIKVQTNDSQCSQRDYKGNCVNYINTPVEKWFKRSEIYPK